VLALEAATGPSTAAKWLALVWLLLPLPLALPVLLLSSELRLLRPLARPPMRVERESSRLFLGCWLALPPLPLLALPLSLPLMKDANMELAAPPLPPPLRKVAKESLVPSNSEAKSLAAASASASPEAAAVAAPGAALACIVWMGKEPPMPSMSSFSEPKTSARPASPPMPPKPLLKSPSKKEENMAAKSAGVIHRVDCESFDEQSLGRRWLAEWVPWQGRQLTSLIHRLLSLRCRRPRCAQQQHDDERKGHGPTVYSRHGGVWAQGRSDVTHPNLEGAYSGVVSRRSDRSGIGPMRKRS
jgi:hypothetical protein